MDHASHSFHANGSTAGSGLMRPRRVIVREQNTFTHSQELEGFSSAIGAVVVGLVMRYAGRGRVARYTSRYCPELAGTPVRDVDT